jgi:putative restriction endonuclease
MIDLELDNEVRAVAFARVQDLRERFGGRIPVSSLREGVTVRGERVPIGDFYRGIHKPRILGRNGAALSIQTSAESPYEDAHERSTGRLIYKFRGTDPNHPDNTALRRALEHRRPLIYFEAVDPGVYDVVMPVFVVSEDESRLQFTLMADINWSEDDVPTPIETVRREYVTRAVMARLHQHHFRRIVLKAYGNLCSICRLRYLELLDAAHILPDKHPEGEPSVENGLALCRIHHAAFDAQIMGIDPDARVHVRSDVLRQSDGPMLRHGLQELHGTKLVLPRSPVLRPNRAYLAQRFRAFLDKSA